MKLQIIQIGNSKGIRIPQSLMKQCNFQDEVNVKIKAHSMILSPSTKKPRENWESAFKQMRQNKEDILLIPSMLDDDMDWEW